MAPSGASVVDFDRVQGFVVHVSEPIGAYFARTPLPAVDGPLATAT